MNEATRQVVERSIRTLEIDLARAEEDLVKYRETTARHEAHVVDSKTRLAQLREDLANEEGPF